MPDRRISSLRDLQPGDHIKHDCALQKNSKKTLDVMHHALVVNITNDTQLMVIHNNGEIVEEKSITIDPRYITVVEYDCVYSGIEAIERARTRLGDGYDVLRDNCEHFVTWARTGKAKSEQVIKVAKTVLKGAAVGAVIGTVVPGVGTVIGGVVGGTIGLLGEVLTFVRYTVQGNY